MKKRTGNALTTIFTAAMAAIGGAIAGAAAMTKIMGNVNGESKELSEKHLALMLLLNQWLQTKQEGKSITEYFHRNDIKTVAIYGMSYVGERLFDELKDTDIEVKCAIDKNAAGIFAETEMITPEDALPEVDAIIVTPVYYFNQIELMLKEKTKAEILSLEDILYEL